MASRALASRVAPRMRALAQPQLAAAVGPALVVPQAPASRRGIVHAESIGTVVQVGKQSQWIAMWGLSIVDVVVDVGVDVAVDVDGHVKPDIVVDVKVKMNTLAHTRLYICAWACQGI